MCIDDENRSCNANGGYKKSNRNPRHAFNLPQFIKPRNKEIREALIYQKSVPYLRFNVFRDEIFEALNTFYCEPVSLLRLYKGSLEEEIIDRSIFQDTYSNENIKQREIFQILINRINISVSSFDNSLFFVGKSTASILENQKNKKLNLSREIIKSSLLCFSSCSL